MNTSIHNNIPGCAQLMTLPALHNPLHSKTESLKGFVQDSWALICQLPSESAPRSSLDRTGKDTVRQHGARIMRVIWTLLPTLMHLEGKLSGHQKGQNKQCSLHHGGSWSTLLRAEFCCLINHYSLSPAHITPSRTTGLWQGTGTGGPLGPWDVYCGKPFLL